MFNLVVFLYTADFGPRQLKGDAAIFPHSSIVTAEIIASIPNKFCSMIKRTEYSLRVAHRGNVCYLRFPCLFLPLL